MLVFGLYDINTYACLTAASFDFYGLVFSLESFLFGWDCLELEGVWSVLIRLGCFYCNT